MEDSFLKCLNPNRLCLSYEEHLMGALKYNRELLQKMASLKIHQSKYLLRKNVL